jgi:AAA ATPase domain
MQQCTECVVNFRIANLGRIQSADFDLKPLTVFVGKNNTNKTWTAYALYGILRSMTWFMRSGFSTAEQVLPSCEQLDSAVEGIARRTAKVLADRAQPAEQDGQQSFTLEVTREDVLKDANINGSPILISMTPESLAKVLAVDPAVVAASEAELACDAEFFRANGKVKSLKFVSSKQTVAISGTSPTGQQWPVATFSSLSERLTEDYIYDQINVCVRWLAFAVFGDALGFPAERKAIAALLTFLEPVQREAKLRAVLNLPSIDFIKYLLAARQPSQTTSTFSKVIGLLEQKVMNGRVDFEGPPEARVFNYKSDDGPHIQIHAVASLVRALAGFDIYLRHHSHGIIVIDEPEMNAHPEAQLKLVEILAMLANKGLRIILTTHSPYFLDHLNNLVEGGSLDDAGKTLIANRTKLGDRDAFISADDVAAYLFREDGTVKSILEAGTIDVDSFASESDYVNNFYSEIRSAKTGR